MTESVDWQTLREEFPTFEEVTYLNTCSLGLLPREGREAVNRYLDLWTSLGASAWYGPWLDEAASLRREFATLINASEEEVALVPSISAGLAAISSSLDFSRRNGVVTTELDFPTVPHHFLALAPRGVETRVLPSTDHISVESALFEEAISEQTALVATSRVFFTSGYIQDVAQLAEVSHRQGALLLVDDYQATGQLPIDVKSAGVDILISGGLKWLLGGPGIAYMYVRKELIKGLKPTATGWFAHRDQFSFNPREMVFKDDARRFEAGTPSVAAVYSARAGLSLVNKIGPQALRRRTDTLTRDLVWRLKEGGFSLRVPQDPEHHASITIVEAVEPQVVVQKLREQNIIVDARPGGVRVSPYFYNLPQDNQALTAALEGIREESPALFAAD